MADIDEILLTDILFNDDFGKTPAGDVETVQGLENIKLALFRRLVTTPGSLIHRPDYGVGIKDFQNALNNIANQRQLAIKIKEQFEQDERVDAVSGVQVKSADNTPDKVEILVRVKIIGYSEQVMNFIPFGEG